MKEILEKILNDEAARNPEVIETAAAEQAEFLTWS